jgi:competence protein ComEC
MVNWHEAPLLRATFALILGIIIANFLEFHIVLQTILGAVAFVCFFLMQRGISYKWRWVSGIFNLIFFIIAGIFSVYFHDESFRNDFLGNRIVPKSQATIVGMVSELPEEGKNIKITVDVTTVNDTLAKGHILLYMKPSEFSSNISYGDIISFKGYVNPIRISKNPSTFDFQRYMKYHNIRYLSYVKEEDIELKAQRRGAAIWHFAYDSQEVFMKILATYLPDSEEFSVASALIVGYRSQIPDEVIQAYVNTGALHVLSVSGLHVGLVSVILNVILRKIKSRSKLKIWNWLDPLLQIIFIWMFTFITGAAPCVLRAAVMFSFLILGRSLARTSNIYNILGASCFVLLLWNPYFLYDVGFQLSYMGLVGIVYFQPKIYASGLKIIEVKDSLYNIYHFRFADIKTKNKFLLAIIKFPFADYCWQLTSVSLAATIAVTPLSVFYFHQFPTYFWLSGLIVVPVAAWALYVGIVLFIVHFLSSFVASLVGKLLFGIIWILNNSLYLIEMIPPGAVKHLYLSGITMFLLYFAMLFAIIAINRKELKWLAFGCFGFLTLTAMRHSYQQYSMLKHREITLYNTGFYTLIDCFDGDKVFSIGSKDIPERVINFAAYNYRLSKNIKPDDIQFLGLQDTVTNDNIFYKNGFLVFKNKKILIIDKTFVAEGGKIKTDYVFIRDNPELDFEKMLQNTDFQLLIFDASNKKNKVEKWKKYCTEHDIIFYDIAENYFTITIED